MPLLWCIKSLGTTKVAGLVSEALASTFLLVQRARDNSGRISLECERLGNSAECSEHAEAALLTSAKVLEGLRHGPP